MIKTDEKFEINYIDPSSKTCYDRCPAKYLFERLMGLSLPDASAIPLDYGSDMHLAFPHCYCDDVKCVETAIAAFSKSWNERAYGEEDKARNTLRARASLAEFHRTHKPSVCPYEFVSFPESVRAETAHVVSPNELPFLVDIGASLPLAGRIDAPVRLKMDNSVWALDYKTASEISARYFLNFENSPAAVGYTLALQVILSALKDEVMGEVIEAVRVSKTGNVENQIYYVFVNEHQVKLFIDDTKHTADEILRCNERGEWRQNVSGCAPYSMFGQPGRFCEYKDLCVVGDWREMVKYFKRSTPFHPFEIEK